MFFFTSYTVVILLNYNIYIHWLYVIFPTMSHSIHLIQLALPIFYWLPTMFQILWWFQEKKKRVKIPGIFAVVVEYVCIHLYDHFKYH